MGYESWSELVTVATPAAGAAATLTVPSDWYLELMIVRARLTTSAAVANRVPFLEYQNSDGTAFADFNSGQTIPASGAQIITWSAPHGQVVTTGNFHVNSGMQPIMLPPGFKLSISADALDPADQWDRVTLWCRKYPTGEVGEPYGARPYRPEELTVRLS